MNLQQAPSRSVLIQALEEGYRGPCWHGPSVLTTLRGVDFKRAQYRLNPERNSIWDLVLHLAYTRHRALLHVAKFAGLSWSRFPRRLRKSWWPELPVSLTAATWDADQQLLESYHDQLIQILEEVSQGVLARRRNRKPWPLGSEILGVATHDAYHSGQIRLIDRAATGG